VKEAKRKANEQAAALAAAAAEEAAAERLRLAVLAEVQEVSRIRQEAEEREAADWQRWVEAELLPARVVG
jgi:hypothetical protein